MAERIILTDNIDQTLTIFGDFDTNIKIIEKAYDVSIINRDNDNTAGNAILISGADSFNVDNDALTVTYLKKMANLNDVLTEQNVEYVINMINDGKDAELREFDDDCICITTRGKPIKAKTVGQRRYVDLIKANIIVMGVGPAGTGKTFLAVTMAVAALKKGEVKRIVLTRPAVEAGENLGFLPGDRKSVV